MSWTDIKPILDQYGLPLAGLLATLYGIWRVLKWTGTNVVLPIKDRHIAFLDKLEVSIDKLTEEAKGWKCQAAVYSGNRRPPESHAP